MLKIETEWCVKRTEDHSEAEQTQVNSNSTLMSDTQNFPDRTHVRGRKVEVRESDLQLRTPTWSYREIRHEKYATLN